MSTGESKKTWVPISFNASNVLQLLAALASFLAAFVLPASFPEFEGSPQKLLIVLGVGFLLVTLLSMLLRPWLTLLAQKIGIRSRMLLPREGIVYLGIMLVIAIAALTGGNPDTGNMLLLIFGMMAGPFVFNGWVVVAMLARVKVSRHLPVSVAAGTLFSVEIRLQNGKKLLSSRLVEVRDVIQGLKVRDEGKVVFVCVAPGQQRSAHYDISISRRGLYQFGPIRLSSRFPLGIGERGHVVSADDEVIVHPKIGRLLAAWTRRECEFAESGARSNARIGLYDDEFHGIREYRSGDNPRAIHWRSSARHGQIMVRQHEQHREADLIVLLDLHSSQGFSEPLQERAISLAATICVEQTRMSTSGRYRLMIAGHELQQVECSGSGGFRDAALKELAVCQPSVKAELGSMLLAVCQSSLAPNSRFVLITPRPEVARLLADSIAQENLRHEQQFIGRLMILTADEATLSATLALDLDTFPAGDEKLTSTAMSSAADLVSVPLQGDPTREWEVSVLGGSDRKLQSAFFRSMTLTTAAAALLLCHSEGNFFPAALIPFIAIMAWIFVDHLGWIRLPTWLANGCGLAALAMSIYEFSRGTVEGKLLSGAHMLVYLTCIVLMMHKGYRQYWWLLALILLQMAVAAVLQTGVFFGGSMLIMMALLLWTLSIFSLYRVMDQYVRRQLKHAVFNSRPRHDSRSVRSSWQHNSNDLLIQIHNGLQRDTSEPWVGWRFRTMVSGSFVVSLILAVFVFAAFPRVWVPATDTFAAETSSQGGRGSRSGFNDKVTLGHVGRIMLSQQRVLLFSVTRLKSQEPVSAADFAAAIDMDEVRFRGNALGTYHSGNWNVGVREPELVVSESTPDRFAGSDSSDAEFQVEITQDAPVGMYAFAPYPVVEIRGAGNSPLRMRPVTATITWAGNPVSGQPLTFTVKCPRIDPTSEMPATFAYWTILDHASASNIDDMKRSAQRTAHAFYVMANIDAELPRLHGLASQLCLKDGRLISEAERVRVVLQYLSAENGFQYSTLQTRDDKSLDPVEDFLFNTKSGHCEYYASACTLMLQSVQIPARLVNGYYGSDVNSMTGSNEIRQRHAHSWVEAFLNGRWQTLEPTPAAARRETVAAGKANSLINNLQTAISDMWNDGVHNMSAERQKAFFAPVISKSKSMFESIRQQGFLTATSNAVQAFLRSPASWFSWRGGLVTFLLLLASGLILRLHPLAHFLRAVQSLVTRFSEKQRTRRSVIRFYARFCGLCEQYGMQLSAADSALENGRASVLRFGERLQTVELREMPMRIATAFNEVRFGKVELTDEQAARIGQDLTDFATALSHHQNLPDQPLDLHKF
ncbi:MAG: DUF3488 domain-containing protein [Planctomycetota bacterium]|nr:MAG: DUF3488 domain-containing protein [Planctomycetota bacterium]